MAKGQVSEVFFAANQEDRDGPTRFPSMTSMVEADWSPPACPVITTFLEECQKQRGWEIQLQLARTRRDASKKGGSRADGRRKTAHDHHPDESVLVEGLVLWVRGSNAVDDGEDDSGWRGQERVSFGSSFFVRDSFGPQADKRCA